MDEVSRGIASAALTLQSVLLQALVAKGVLSYAEALGTADKGFAATRADLRDEDEAGVAEVTVACLEQIHEGLAGMAPVVDLGPEPSSLGKPKCGRGRVRSWTLCGEATQ